jgi:hypothetical protein
VRKRNIQERQMERQTQLKKETGKEIKQMKIHRERERGRDTDR